MKKSLCPTIAAFGLAFFNISHAGDFTYTTNADNTITITGYTGAGGKVIIPSTIDGFLVTSIGTNAFLRCFSLTSVTIPNSVTCIGNYTFSGCTNLTSVTIPDSVTNIGDNAFSECGSLTNVTIGGGVKSIGDFAFLGCGSLANVTIPDSLTSIGSGAFADCGLTRVIIPGSVTNIGDSAFELCLNLLAIDVNLDNDFFLSLDGVLFDKSESTLIQFPVGCGVGRYTIPSRVMNIGYVAFEV